MSKKYYIIPVIYALVIVLFFVLQFTGNEKFTESVGNLTVTGISSAKSSGTEGKVTRITVTHQGLCFSFTRDRGVELELESGRRIIKGLRSYTLFPDGVELVFGDNYHLRFLIARGVQKKVSIIPGQPETGEPVRSVIIPFSVCDGGNLTQEANIPIAVMHTENNSYFISMPQGSSIDTKQGFFTVSEVNNKPGTISLEYPGKDNTDPFLYWFSKTKEFITQEDYQKSINTYLSKAYQGWSSTRFDRTKGTWAAAGNNGENAFSEPVYLALYSEALKRGDSTVLRDAREAGRRHPDKLSFAASAYEGNITRAFTAFQEQDKSTWTRITGLVNQQDTTVFSTPHLVQFVIDRGPYSLLQELFTIAEAVNISQADIDTCLGLFQFFIDINTYLSDIPADLEKLGKIPDERLLPAIFIHKNGLFFQNSQGNLDPALTLKAGLLLRKQGLLNSNKVLITIGREMIYSSLQYADDSGFLPAALHEENGTLNADWSGKIPPEEFYPDLPAKEFYPHFKSLYTLYGPGTWIHTAAEISSIEGSADKLELNLAFPEGKIHNIVIQGIDRVTGIRMLGLNWRSAPDFQIYFSGWLYNEETRTLFIKFRNRTKNETITMLF